MAFTKVFNTWFTIFIIKAFVVNKVHPSVIETTPSNTHSLLPRALPPCPQIWPPLPYPNKREKKHALNVVKNEPKPYGWRPSICPDKMWNCVYVQPDITGPVGGITAPAKYPIDDGRAHVEIYEYWQSTIMWNGLDGTVLSYMAHGVDYTCVKGTMGVTWLGNKSTLVFDKNHVNSDGYTCDCHYPLDDDKIVWIHKK